MDYIKTLRRIRDEIKKIITWPGTANSKQHPCPTKERSSQKQY
jgi:hypothetical protein